MPVTALAERVGDFNISMDPWEQTGAAPQGWASHLHQTVIPVHIATYLSVCFFLCPHMIKVLTMAGIKWARRPFPGEGQLTLKSSSVTS